MRQHDFIEYTRDALFSFFQRKQKRIKLCFTDMNKLCFFETGAFRHKIRQKSPLRSGIVFASSEVVHRPGHYHPLHFDNKNIQQICMNLMICF